MEELTLKSLQAQELEATERIAKHLEHIAGSLLSASNTLAMIYDGLELVLNKFNLIPPEEHEEEYYEPRETIRQEYDPERYR